MEIVRRLDAGLAEVIPDQNARLRHILSTQVFEMSHSEIATVTGLPLGTVKSHINRGTKSLREILDVYRSQQ